MQLPVDKSPNWDGPPLLEEAGPHTIKYQGPTCNYQSNGAQAGSSRSTCGLVALNYTRLSLGLEVGDEAPASPWLRLISQANITDATSIIDWDELKGITQLNVTELLDVPFFQETLITKAATTNIQTVEDVKDLFLKWFPGPSSNIHAAVLSSNAEAVVCLSFPSPVSRIYSLFDSHARPDHGDGPAFTFSGQLDDIVQRLHDSILSQSATFSKEASENLNLSAYLLELKGGHNSDMRDVLARSATHLSRRQMGVDDTATSSFVESDHISLLRLRAESLRKIRSQEFSDSGALSDPLSEVSWRKENKSSVGPRRNGEFGWQLSLLLESNPVPGIVVSGGDANAEQEVEASSRPNRMDVTDNENDPLLPSHRRSEYSWLTSLVRQPSTYTVWPSPEGSEGGFTSSEAGSPEKKDTWEAALMQQLQEEEEISASLSHRVSSEHTWLVTLQKRLQEDESLKLNTAGPSSLLRSELDWQLAVQLQQEALRNESLGKIPEKTPRITSESGIDDTTVEHEVIKSPGRNLLQVPLWRRSENTSIFETLDLPSQALQPSFECGICAEMHLPREKITLADCDHKFCNECLTTFTRTRIEEGRYPTFCPECFPQRTRTNKSQVTQDIVEKLKLTAEELRRLEELQLRAHSVTLECPRCCQSMKIDREQYGQQSVIVCPLPQCGHMWCKSCIKTLASSQENHRCKNGNIDRLMKRKGWKYCPGCRTPVQKESGCNHMTCGAPGCNTHFCYRCGVLIIDTTYGGDVGTAVTEHYLNCRLFEKRLKCSIQ
ncbi:hypothetical protein CPB84DRAFT_1765783 [Gymnopilus junonius]|uniref:RING-type domain-containing protein n=1 Tax=Gymnopilus junonius TaxID=109634 RepID=A0A9P5NU60_GYMJU|nr:hypothetical protein CPB84DRAFT_1765783 [Gymnopilus junonius]